MVTETPVLAHYKHIVETIVETDFFDDVSSGVFFQLDNDKQLHPVSFFSENLNSPKCNCEIYDKELLAVTQCFKQWTKTESQKYFNKSDNKP